MSSLDFKHKMNLAQKELSSEKLIKFGLLCVKSILDRNLKCKELVEDTMKSEMVSLEQLSELENIVENLELWEVSDDANIIYTLKHFCRAIRTFDNCPEFTQYMIKDIWHIYSLYPTEDLEWQELYLSHLESVRS